MRIVGHAADGFFYEVYHAPQYIDTLPVLPCCISCKIDKFCG